MAQTNHHDPWFSIPSLPRYFAASGYFCPNTDEARLALILTTLVTVVILVRQVRWGRREALCERICQAYVATATVTLALILILQMCYILVAPALTPDNAARAFITKQLTSTPADGVLQSSTDQLRFVRSVNYIPLLAGLSFIYVGLNQALINYGILRAVFTIWPPKHELEYVVNAAALHLATRQVALFLFSGFLSNGTAQTRAVYLTEQAFSIHMHIVFGCIVGLRAIPRDSRPSKNSLRRIVGRPALYLGSIDFVIGCAHASNGQIHLLTRSSGFTGTYTPVVCVVILLVASYDCWQHFRKLQLRAC